MSTIRRPNSICTSDGFNAKSSPALNPVVINVAIASNEEKDFEIEVVNTNGQSLSKIHTGTISKAIIQIPAEVFAQGMYSVKISDGTQTKAFKVTK